MTDIKRIDIAEFREFGYLHEINRLLLHPLGLALEVRTATEPVRKVTLSERDARELEELCRFTLAGAGGLSIETATTLLDALSRGVPVKGEELGGIWDCRSDPEGVHYGEDLLSAEKAEHIAEQILARRAERKKRLGYVIQPVETEKPTLTTTYLDPAERSGRSKRRVEHFTGIGEVEFEGEGNAAS